MLSSMKFVSSQNSSSKDIDVPRSPIFHPTMGMIAMNDNVTPAMNPSSNFVFDNRVFVFPKRMPIIGETASPIAKISIEAAAISFEKRSDAKMVPIKKVIAPSPGNSFSLPAIKIRLENTGTFFPENFM